MLRQSECIYGRFMVIFSKNPSDWERNAKKGASDIVTSVKKVIISYDTMPEFIFDINL